MLKLVSTVILLLLLCASTVYGAHPMRSQYQNLDEKEIKLNQVVKTPVLIVLAPIKDTIPLAAELYKKLFVRFPEKAFMVISPGISRFLPNAMAMSMIDVKIPKEMKARVLIDWDKLFANKYYATETTKPLIMLITPEGTVLGRYRFQSVDTAYDMAINVFGDELGPFPER
ncbi:MAG: hypothetical protein HQM11_00560 [SAR324 cluster bacterium]|nr:hypothetical protein [SAR324 cluster bacterium]